MLPDLERIGEFWGNPKTRTFAELLIDCEENRTLGGAHGHAPREGERNYMHLGTPKPRRFQDRYPPLPVHAFIGTVVLEEKDHFVGRPLLVELRIEFAQRSVDCVPYAPKFCHTANAADP